MRLIKNTGADRVFDQLLRCLSDDATVDIASPALSLFAFSELRQRLQSIAACRLLTGSVDPDFSLVGSIADRPFRNRLNTHWIAREFAKWLSGDVDLRVASQPVAQAILAVSQPEQDFHQVIFGNCSLTTEGLGLTPATQLGMVQCFEGSSECQVYRDWFHNLWDSVPSSESDRAVLLQRLQELAAHKAPALIYHLTLLHLFSPESEQLDEEQIIKSATGIRETRVWNKLYRFQRDGVIGAIDKLERFGGCIIADSVGLGKTFEALAIIKYYELRNDRVLVLAPKRLRDNWTIYRANDRRNVLASDRFNFDVLNHTDLSRDGGLSGDIDLTHVNWGNYDLVVIDESHNFRNKKTPRQDQETRYDRLMRKIIKEGVKTRVLMLSATPVNNRLADLRNQISFATEGNDMALADHGIASINNTTRIAQKQFNDWLKLDDTKRSPSLLVEMLGFDYFRLLDLLTIARSRKHIEKYYGTAETGRFPTRRKPINIKPDVDSAGQFQSIREINREIRRLNLASYAPLRYVLPHKQEAYNARYTTQLRSGDGQFRPVDREESLIHLLRVNVLKRLESAIPSFTLTVKRQLDDVEAALARLNDNPTEVEELDIEDIDVDDPAFETLLIGTKVKVLLQDVDHIRWRQDLVADRDRLAALYAAACQIDAARDAKLEALQNVIAEKCSNPINPGNRKVIVFTAFADTAEYLYSKLSGWAKDSLGFETALVTGTGRNQTTLPGLRRDLASVLSAFAPRAKERPAELADEGELDLLIATDCISEGQNLQDCDYLVNYDIHWNPVRIIQRFGRIDRLGSQNQQIQLVNFWPNIELEEYINLEQRVSGRMALLDVSATGEENLIEQQAANQMNDLEYRRKQLIRLQDAVIDLEDLSTGVSIADLTLTDFRIDLAQYKQANAQALETAALGSWAVVEADPSEIPPGIVFCLRAETGVLPGADDTAYPLAPHYLVHVAEDGAVLLPFMQAKQILDRLRQLCAAAHQPISTATTRFDHLTKQGADMRHAQKLLAAAVASVTGKSEERAIASLFAPGGTHALKGEFTGIHDFEVIAFLVILPECPEGTEVSA